MGKDKKQKQDHPSADQLAGVVKLGEDHDARITALEQQVAALKQTLAASLGVSFDAA